MLSNSQIITISILLISLIIGSKYISKLLSSDSIDDEYEYKPRVRSLTEKYSKEYDLVIVGTGLSGLTSAYQAYLLSKNTRILILESSSTYGGESIKDIDGINFLNSPLEKKENIYDNSNSYYNDTNTYGRKDGSPDLIQILVDNSYDLYNFYTNELKANFRSLVLTEGSLIKRTHFPNNNETAGYYLINLLYKKLINIPTVKFIFNATAIDLLTLENGNGTINGLIYETVENNLQKKNHTVITKSIILATGGYGHDYNTEDSLLKKHSTSLHKYPTFNSQYIKGWGIKMANKIGANLVSMRNVEVYPTCFVNNFDRYNREKILAPLELLKIGGILIHQRLKRFINELTNRYRLTNNILKHCDIVADPAIIRQYEAYLIINEKFVIGHENIIKPYEEKYLKKYSSLKEFAEQYGKKEYYKNLEKAISDYNTNNTYDRYGRDDRPYFDINSPVYVGVVTPCIFHTLGGLKVNKKAEVVKEEETEVINGLFAAGEVIGNVHGGSVLPGNALTQSGVFGRIAAKSAIEYILNKTN